MSTTATKTTRLPLIILEDDSSSSHRTTATTTTTSSRRRRKKKTTTSSSSSIGSRRQRNNQRLDEDDDDDELPDHDRHLSSDEDDDNNNNDEYTYLVDPETGTPYDEPYALAWRYLGLYRDCSSSNYEGACDTTLLWAAYYDAHYSGNEIGEYQFWRNDGGWDKTACKSHKGGRCAKMNCHVEHDWTNHHYQLVGVYKETNGLEEWAEQLFKHQGYCLFDTSGNDSYGYDFMQEVREEKIPYDCEWYANAVDTEGNYHYFYWMVQPVAGGNVGLGLYEDEACTEESYYEVEDVLYAKNNGDDSVLEEYETTLKKFNDGLDRFKVCQPCRAYNLYPNNSNNNRRQEEEEERRLNNDGQGNAEMWGYDCYDDAGYTNCNQCYKFETQTEMEVASISDLQEASAQGTILSIRAYGQHFGQGHYPPPWTKKLVASFANDDSDDLWMGLMALVMVFFASSIVYMSCQMMRDGRKQKRSKQLPLSFQENLMEKRQQKKRNSNRDDDDDEDNDTASSCSSSSTSTTNRNSYRFFPSSLIGFGTTTTRVGEQGENDSKKTKTTNDDSTTAKKKKKKTTNQQSSYKHEVVSKSQSWGDKVFETSEIVLGPLAKTKVADRYANFLVQQGLVVPDYGDNDDDDDDGLSECSSNKSGT
eukprot:CAMPEP_0194206278 /NCGR_PEP_ID=MMETSP0156-20130528/5348_1 /TAXON_ID=33649 /ORGANISM="Thalassionema nitzschioides, Strain L26-B" /LENGTH=645 /DNA_ID=CAMNT_0038932757 /DNA_START=46 /DNA_END=1983 /DNA_ORIENTATION=+